MLSDLQIIGLTTGLWIIGWNVIAKENIVSKRWDMLLLLIVLMIFELG